MSRNGRSTPEQGSFAVGKVYESINDTVRTFIERQQMFFVGTAPLSREGSVNLSPKGLDSLRMVDELTVVYADLVGSGIETVAHVKENGRIVLMFCAFEGAPKIIRLHGRGEVIDRDHADFESMSSLFPSYTGFPCDIGLRCFIRVHCQRISDSCGFGVPSYEFQGQRSQLQAWAERKSLTTLDEYVTSNNQVSIDGLPGLEPRSPS